MKKLFLVLLFLLIAAGQLSAQTNLTVAADGSAQFKTVQEAIMAVPSGSATNPVIIRIKPGTYKEQIYIQREKRFFRVVGENATNTILTYDLNANLPGKDGKPIGTFRTPSTQIDADDFTAENITFENSAGPVGQALAIRLDGDRCVFRNCRFLGWQDTILANRGRHYFENCYIAGHTDFIFGAATCWFEKCHVHCLRNGYVTAASTPVDQPFGYVFNNCKITGEPGVKTFLGRPWRIYASTIFLNTEMSEVIRPEGWNDWGKPEAHTTTRYAEFNSTGAGASATNRPDWTKQLTAAEAKAITAEKVLAGNDGWNPRRPAPTPLFKPKNATMKTDIQYGKAGAEKLFLDACVPDGDGTFPVALIVHGGGWSAGDKRDMTTVFEPLTAAKFTWFSINYRLAPTNRWPACFDDVQTAIRWVKKHAGEFKGDPKRIALFGYSAGGHLVCHAAVLAKSDTRIQAVVGFAAPTDLVSDNERRGGLSISMRNLFNCESTNITDTVRVVLKKNSPLTYVKPGLPPFLFIHGTEDKSVPYSQSVVFQSKLKDVKVPCEIITIKDAGHRINEWSRFNPGYQEEMVVWLKENLGSK